MSVKGMKKLSVCAISAAVLAACPAPAQAATPTAPESQSTCVVSSDPGILRINSCSLTAGDQKFLDEVAEVAGSFYNNGGVLGIRLSDAELIADHGFSQADVQRLHEHVLGIALPATAPTRDASQVTPSISVIGKSGICLSHDDLTTGVGVAFATAAAAGPEGVAAALAALGTAVGGPVGTAVGAITALLSGPSLIEIAGRTVSALATNRGVAIKVVADYPPVQADYC